ncbi:hypothetical protein DIKCMJMK_03271 [Shewanella oneidensis]|nr:hypothetical protein [Shewanella oneidensis]
MHPYLLKEEGLLDIEHVLVSDIVCLESDQGVHFGSLVADATSCKIVGNRLCGHESRKPS